MGIRIKSAELPEWELEPHRPVLTHWCTAKDDTAPTVTVTLDRRGWELFDTKENMLISPIVFCPFCGNKLPEAQEALRKYGEGA